MIPLALLVLAAADGGAVGTPPLNAMRGALSTQLGGDWSVLVCGGAGPTMPTCERYVIDENQWVLGPTMNEDHGDCESARLLDDRFMILDNVFGGGELLDDGGFTFFTMPVFTDFGTLTVLPNGDAVAFNGGGLHSWGFPNDGGPWFSLPDTPDFMSDESTVQLTDGTMMMVGGSSVDGGGRLEVLTLPPDAGTWSLSGTLTFPLIQVETVLLPDGSILAVGATDLSYTLSGAQLSNDRGATWLDAGVFGPSLYGPWSPRLMPDDRVLLAGNSNTSIYEPATGVWSVGPQATRAGSATLLPTGRLLLVGDFASLVDLFVPSSVVGPVPPAALTGEATVKLTSGRLFVTEATAGVATQASAFFDA